MKPGHATRFIEHLRPSKAFEDNAVVSFEGSAASFNAPAADEDAGSKKGKKKDKKGKGYATPPTNSSPFDDGDDLVMVSLDDPGAPPLRHKASPSALCTPRSPQHPARGPITTSRARARCGDATAQLAPPLSSGRCRPTR